MAKRGGPRMRRMSPSRRAVSRLERLRELESRTARGREEGSENSVATFSRREDVADPLTIPAERPVQPNGPSTYLPARMINEFVYCPRLFYYEYVEGVFVDNADTIRGSQGHKRVDQGSGALPAADSEPRTEEPETIHARSVELASDRLGVVSKMDLVEVRADADLFSKFEVCPVEYKSGAPREGENGIELWDTDKIQLALQCLILKDNGYDLCSG